MALDAADQLAGKALGQRGKRGRSRAACRSRGRRGLDGRLERRRARRRRDQCPGFGALRRKRGSRRRSGDPRLPAPLELDAILQLDRPYLPRLRRLRLGPLPLAEHQAQRRRTGALGFRESASDVARHHGVPRTTDDRADPRRCGPPWRLGSLEAASPDPGNAGRERRSCGSKRWARERRRRCVPGGIRRTGCRCGLPRSVVRRPTRLGNAAIDEHRIAVEVDGPLQPGAWRASQVPGWRSGAQATPAQRKPCPPPRLRSARTLHATRDEAQRPQRSRPPADGNRARHHASFRMPWWANSTLSTATCELPASRSPDDHLTGYA